MRITGGNLKGRVVQDKKLNLRPTTNRAKQGLFNILNNHIIWQNSNALDLFSGTGNLTYELASRGCESVTAVDMNRHNCKLISRNAKELGFLNVQVVHREALSFIKSTKDCWSLILADPPYDYPNYEALVHSTIGGKLLTEKGLLVVEHSRRTDLSHLAGFVERRKYGEVNFSFFSNKPPAIPMQP